MGTAAYSNQGGTAVGYQSGKSFATGSDYNTLLGYQAGYGITTTKLEFLQESRPMYIWGLGATHDVLTSDAHLHRTHQLPFIGDRSIDALLMKFTSLDIWPDHVTDGARG
jgi:hypothetical protein